MKTYKTLSRMPYAQAKVIIEDGEIYLKSYNTIVACIIDGYLTVNGLYSMTTRRHISAFAKEYADLFDFAIIRELANSDLAYNISSNRVEEVC